MNSFTKLFRIVSKKRVLPINKTWIPCWLPSFNPSKMLLFNLDQYTIQIGKLTATLDVRLYLHEKTVRRLNRRREAGQRLSLRSKNHLARMILEELRPWLPGGEVISVETN